MGDVFGTSVHARKTKKQLLQDRRNVAGHSGHSQRQRLRDITKHEQLLGIPVGSVERQFKLEQNPEVVKNIQQKVRPSTGLFSVKKVKRRGAITRQSTMLGGLQTALNTRLG